MAGMASQRYGKVARSHALGRRAASATTFMCLAAAVAWLGAGVHLQAWLMPTHQVKSSGEGAVASRRMLLGLAASSALLPAAQPALAAKQLEVSGFPGKSFKANGIYTAVDGISKNGRPVFKNDKEEFFLYLNDCKSFQIDAQLDGCKGLAVEAGGKWFVDGEQNDKIKVKPVESQAEKAERLKAAKAAQDAEKAAKAAEKAAKAAAAPKAAAPKDDDDAVEFKADDIWEQLSGEETPELGVRKYLSKENTNPGQFFKTNKQEEDSFDRLSSRLGSFKVKAAPSVLEPKANR